MSKEEQERKASSGDEPSTGDARQHDPHAGLDDHPEEGRLLTSRAFWIGGLLCIVLWLAIAALLGAF